MKLFFKKAVMLSILMGASYALGYGHASDNRTMTSLVVVGMVTLQLIGAGDWLRAGWLTKEQS